MKKQKMKPTFNSIERNLLLLSYQSTNLEENIDKIIQEIEQAFGPIENPSELFMNLIKIQKAKNLTQFQVHKTMFIMDFTNLYANEVSSEFEQFTDQIKRIKFKTKNSTDIFIVHGHNEKMKEAVSTFVKDIGLNPIILHEQPNQGKTIIEKFTTYSDVSFAIVLLSGDDFGYSKLENKTKAKPRARQNVIFELGFFIGKIGRENVVALFEQIDSFEFPSDFQGVIYEPFSQNENWKISLKNEIELAGFTV